MTSRVERDLMEIKQMQYWASIKADINAKREAIVNALLTTTTPERVYFLQGQHQALADCEKILELKYADNSMED